MLCFIMLYEAVWIILYAYWALTLITQNCVHCVLEFRKRTNLATDIPDTTEPVIFGYLFFVMRNKFGANKRSSTWAALWTKFHIFWKPPITSNYCNHVIFTASSFHVVRYAFLQRWLFRLLGKENIQDFGLKDFSHGIYINSWLNTVKSEGCIAAGSSIPLVSSISSIRSISSNGNFSPGCRLMKCLLYVTVSLAIIGLLQSGQSTPCSA